MKLCLACGHRFEATGWGCPACGRSPRIVGSLPVFAPDLAGGDGSDAAYLYADIASAEARHFWFRSRNRLIVWALRRYFPGARCVLDMGCGTGFVLTGIREAFPQVALFGSDALTRGLSHAAARLPEATLLQMDARRIPFAEEFDVIGAFDVLEHIVEDEAVLREMFRAAQPGGGILLTVPQHRFLWSSVDEFSHHKRRYSRRELVGRVRGAGFEVLRATSFVSLLLPLLLLSRLRQRQGADRVDPLAEYRIHPLANAVLERVLDVERALISVGVPLPAGGSLLVVARRPPSS